MKYKDNIPENTIKILTDIFHDLGVDLEMHTIDNKTVFSNALNMYYNGVRIGNSNGKAINEVYSKCSSLAELMERLSNDFLFSFAGQSVLDTNLLKKSYEKYGFCTHSDERVISAKEIIQQKLFKQIIKSYGKISFLPLIDFEKKEIKENIITLPFKEINTNAVNYIPFFGKGLFFVKGTNGMAAGNSFYEAMAEGISELFEREALFNIVLKKAHCPNISIELIKNNTKFGPFIEELKTNDIEITFKDLSMGKKFPVIGLIARNKKTGKFAIKAAASPIFHVAVERCFTELFQNHYMDSFQANMLNYYSFNTQEYTSKTIVNVVRDNHCLLPETFLYNTDEIDYLDNFMFDINETKTTKDLFNFYQDLIKKQNLTCWFHDASYYNFNAYEIIIPEFTEPLIAPPESFDSIYESFELCVPENITKDMYYNNINIYKFKEYIDIVIEKKEPVLFALFDGYSVVSKTNKDDGTIINLYAFIVCFILKDYEKCYKIINGVSKNFSLNNSFSINEDFDKLLFAIKYYVICKNENKDEDEIKNDLFLLLDFSEKEYCKIFNEKFLITYFLNFDRYYDKNYNEYVAFLFKLKEYELKNKKGEK